jgi:hypothetical protein
LEKHFAGPGLALSALLSIALPASRAPAQVLTSQMTAARTGADTTETLLTPRNVNAREFGRLFRIPADGDVYAQPLVLPRVRLADAHVHDIVYVATEHCSVDAWDASVPSARPLWHTSFLDPGTGVTTIPSRELQCPFIKPEVGITCTPAIDPLTGTIYVLARTREGDRAGGVRYAQRLHALDVRTGSERAGSPVEIRAAVHGSGDGAEAGTLAFDPLRENPRASLLLVRGLVVLCWASSCDVGPYHGWIMAFDARTLARRGVVVTSPDAAQSGIWQSDTGPAADGTGRIFVITGNGRFDADHGGRDLGNSVLALTATAESLRVADSFTPFDQAALDAEDGDLGSGGPMLAGGDATGPARLVFASKAGKLYVLDPQHLGGYHEGHDAGAVQSFESSDGEYGAPVYWNGHVFIQGSDAPLRDHALRAGRLSEQPVAQSAATMPNPGATPTISANGTRDGIVWLIQSKPFGTEDRPAILRAFDAANLGRELWTSEQNAARDRAGIALRFTIPSVWEGKVYVGTRGGVDVYGLLSSGGAGHAR